MTVRRRRILAALVVGGVVLVLLGGGLLALGLWRGGDVNRVLGILLAVLGLAALRAASWVRRARLMTQTGMRLRDQDHQPGGSQQPESE